MATLIKEFSSSLNPHGHRLQVIMYNIMIKYHYYRIDFA
jgi:hypothetical protein